MLTRHGNRQDRRPITPPPCIKLVVKDAETMKDIDIKSVPISSDHCTPISVDVVVQTVF